MKQDSPISRRGVLKATGGVAGAALVGGAGLAAMTGGASAQASFDLNISDAATLSNDEGKLHWVGVDAQKIIEWDGFDVPVEYIRFKHEIALAGETDWHVLYDGRSGHLNDWSGKDDSNGWGGDGEYVTEYTGDETDGTKGRAVADVQWEIISDGDYDNGYGTNVPNPADWTEQMSVKMDGASAQHEIKWRTTLTLYTENSNGKAVEITDDDGAQLPQTTERFVVPVNNEEGVPTGDTEGSSQSG